MDNGSEEKIVLEYDLYSLPTAQHKAGLAGLILMIDSMKRRKMPNTPELVECTPNRAKIVFTKESMQAIFDDLYDASWIEVESKSKWSGKKHKNIIEIDIETKDGKSKKEKRYIYDDFRPICKFLQTYYPDGDGIWLHLWRDMLWNTLRGKPLTRNVYKERAGETPTSKKRVSSEAKDFLDGINKEKKYKERGKEYPESIASSAFIGAQDVSAEKIPFQGEVRHNFLLHFWTIVILVFIPRILDVKGVFNDRGFVLVIPEPSNLKKFVEDIKQLLKKLECEKSGYRPKTSIIYVPEEGGLEYLYNIARLKIENLDVSSFLNAVEIYQIEKRGNKISILSVERILSDPRILENYDTLRKQTKNPLFKVQGIKNLLQNKPWYSEMKSIFNNYPWEFFIRKKGETPVMIPFFGNDSRKKFEAIEKQVEILKEGGIPMNEELKDDQLAIRVYKLIQSYVFKKTEERSGIKYDDFKDNKDEKGRTIYPPKFIEDREKVCSGSFLAMRCRRENDFVEYFISTICSVPQWLPEEEYLSVSQALLTDWEKVKTLSMLALSANS